MSCCIVTMMARKRNNVGTGSQQLQGKHAKLSTPPCKAPEVLPRAERRRPVNHNVVVLLIQERPGIH